MSRVMPEERGRIVALLHEHGGNRHKVAKICKRSPGTVQTIATEEGIPSAHSAPKKANEAREAFSEMQRRQIVVDGLHKARVMLAGISDAAELQKWSVAVGTLVDKDLLLSGKPTSINESRKGAPSLEELFDRADREAAREWDASGPTEG